MRVVTEGLKPGERVVVNGLQRVRPGNPVTPTPQPAKGGNGEARADEDRAAKAERQAGDAEAETPTKTASRKTVRAHAKCAVRGGAPKRSVRR